MMKVKPSQTTKKSSSDWTAEDSAELYGIRNWGGGYFRISDQGEVVVTPKGPASDVEISIAEIIAGTQARGLSMPLLLRFVDILESRIQTIHESFTRAIKDAGYHGGFQGVYPIKVNQQQQVVEQVTSFGKNHRFGLEAGSKAELIAALAYLDNPEALLVCNGYKDEEFIDLALYAQKMGLQPIIVIEMPGELDLILQRAERMGIRPRLGVRAKLATRATGHWTDSGGDQSMFGLNASQIIELIDRLKKAEMLDALEMLHYHLGSQVPDIRSIRQAVAEASRFYVNMVQEGAAMGILNVGGGLAIDYDGSHTNFSSSRNYTTDEYAADIVEAVMKFTNESNVPHPLIVSESGRATVAHHAVLLFNVLDVSRFEPREVPERITEGMHESLQNLMYVKDALTTKNLQECYHDAVYYRDEMRSQFEHGAITLRERALGESIFWHIVVRISESLRGQEYIPDELEGLEKAIADVYHCNFSVFQSLPDSWAINQLFPLMPIHRLNEKPERSGTLADITCDCDGKISQFIDLQDVRDTLPLHALKEDEYYLGVFLVGAYQETLGDLHNLLGDTNVASVRIGSDQSIEYHTELEGDTVSEVLSYVEYNPQEMVGRLRNLAERAVRQGNISPEERREIVSAYQEGLRGYTYFES